MGAVLTTVLVAVVPSPAPIGAVTDAVANAAPGPTAAGAGSPAQADPGARLPDPEPTPEASRQQADEILSRPEYQPPEQNVLEKILEWLLERLGDLLRPVSGGLGAGGASSIVVWIVVALLFGVGIFFVTRIVSRRRRREDGDESDALLVEYEDERSVGEWQSEADRYEAAGQWKEGLLCRYRALVGQLVERGVVRDIPGRTTGEYRVEVQRRAPEVAGPFAGATELFDRAWYGNRDTGPAEAERFRELTAEVLIGVDRSRADADRAHAASGSST